MREGFLFRRRRLIGFNFQGRTSSCTKHFNDHRRRGRNTSLSSFAVVWIKSGHPWVQNCISTVVSERSPTSQLPYIKSPRLETGKSCAPKEMPFHRVTPLRQTDKHLSLFPFLHFQFLSPCCSLVKLFLRWMLTGRCYKWIAAEAAGFSQLCPAWLFPDTVTAPHSLPGDPSLRKTEEELRVRETSQNVDTKLIWFVLC